MDEELEMKQKEEEKKVDEEQQDGEDTSSSAPLDQDGTDSAEEDEGEEDDDGAPTSFGSVLADQESANDKGNRSKKSPFATTSLTFASGGLFFNSFIQATRIFPLMEEWDRTTTLMPQSCQQISIGTSEPSISVNFRRQSSRPTSLKALKAVGHRQLSYHKTNARLSYFHSLSQILSSPQSSKRRKRHLPKQKPQGRHHQTQGTPEIYFKNILSMHVPISSLENYVDLHAP